MSECSDPSTCGLLCQGVATKVLQLKLIYIVNAVHQILRCLMLRIVGHVFCVLGVSILFLSTILIFAFRIFPTVWYLVFCFFFFLF